MPVRNFRYIGQKQTKSASDGSGIAELYDIYASRIDNKTGYPHTLFVTSNYDSISSLVEGDRFGPNFDFEGYYIEEIFTLSIVSGSSHFRDSSGGSITPSVNTSTGLASASFSTLTFTLESGFAASGEGNTFTMRLSGSVSGTVWEKTFNITAGTYSLSFNSSSYNEGSNTACTLTYSGAPASETIYYGFSPYTYVGGSLTSDDVNITVSGSFTSSATGSGTQNINGPALANDFNTEGSETLQCRVAHYNLSSLSSYYLAFANVTVNDTSQTPSASVSASTTSVNEGGSVTFTVTMTNYSSGSVSYNISLSSDAEVDDVTPNTGTISISGSSGSVVITAVADGYTETGQTETFQLNILSPGDGTTIIGSSPVVTINDTSTGGSEPSGVITQNGNLTAHWDFSLWSSSVGTTYTTNQTLPNTSGTSIGSASSTPSMTFTTTSTSYEASVGTMGSGSLKTLRRPDSTSNGVGAQAYGSPAWPDITSSSIPITILYVIKPISVRSGWNRVVQGAWSGGGTYSGAVVFHNTAGTMNYRTVNTGTSTATSGYIAPSGQAGISNGTLHIYMWSFQGTGIRYAHKFGSSSIVTGSGTQSATRYYGTETTSNRRTYAFENAYWNGNGSVDVGEIAVWNQYWTTTDMSTLIGQLYTKWS